MSCDLVVVCVQLLKMLDGLLVRFDAFDHPLLETMKQSAMEENRTVYAAMQTEVRISQYDFTKAMIALHRLKKTLGSWSDHIDSLSEYPLFDDVGCDGDDGVNDGIMDEGGEDDNYALSESMYSNASFSNQSSSAFPIPGSVNDGESSRVLTRSSIRRKSFVNQSDYSVERSDDDPLARNPSIMSIESTTSAVSEAHSTFSRLLSHSSLLKRGMSGSGVANIVQKPGDPYVSSGSSVLTNTLEQAILGGGVTPGTGAASQFSGAAGGGGGNGNLNPSAAEMIASSMKRQERDDGFALPVFQWAKRFYRSLVAKFTLYFHQWLGPFERQGDFLAHDLTRFIRTPMGISYLQLMDVLLARGCRYNANSLDDRSGV